MLRCLYEEVGGHARIPAHLAKVFEKAVERGVPSGETRPAFDYLVAQRLAERVTMGGTIRITHAGVVEFEATVQRPHEATKHFEPTTIQNFNGPVGVVQTGSHNTANVVQQVSEAAELLRCIAQLRVEAEKLPKESERVDAIEVVDALEAEAKAEQPKKALVKSYAGHLKEYLPTMIPVIQMIIELFLKK